MLWLQIDFGFLSFTSTLSGIVSSILAAVRSLFVFLYNLLRAVFDTLANALVNVARSLWRMLGPIKNFLWNLWENWIKRGVLKLVEWYQRLHAWLQRVLGPTLRWIQKIRALIDKWYNKIFLPILNAIQRVRGILQIFRIFHVKWAKALDDRLLRIENKILQPYLALRRKLNEVATYINLILDPALILRKDLLLSSVFGWLGELRRLFGYGRSGDLTPDVELKQQHRRERYHAENIDAHVSALAQSGPTHEDDDARETFRKALHEVTGAPLPI